jgi:hypothetical protein
MVTSASCGLLMSCSGVWFFLGIFPLFTTQVTNIHLDQFSEGQVTCAERSTESSRLVE